MKLYNCTNHNLTAEQRDGYDVIELPGDLKAQWGQITEENKWGVCDDVVNIITEHFENSFEDYLVSRSIVLVQGHPGATFNVVSRLKGKRGIIPVYAESVRDSTEEIQPDGSVKKVSVFRHKAFRRY